MIPVINDPNVVIADLEVIPSFRHNGYGNWSMTSVLPFSTVLRTIQIYNSNSFNIEVIVGEKLRGIRQIFPLFLAYTYLNNEFSLRELIYNVGGSKIAVRARVVRSDGQHRPKSITPIAIRFIGYINRNEIVSEEHIYRNAAGEVVITNKVNKLK